MSGSPSANSPPAASVLPAPRALLSVRGYGCRRGERWLFEDLSLTLEPGSCWALTGPNGCGKSTLLRSLAGLFRDTTGVLASEATAYLGHRSGVPRLLGVIDGLQWYARLLGSAESLSPLLERVGLAGYEHARPTELSAGQQRRLALARLLLQQAPVWLLDEPYTALDPAGQVLVDQLMTQHCAEGGAVIAATHQPLAGQVPESLANTVRAGMLAVDQISLVPAP